MIYVFCVFPKTSGNASFRIRGVGETNQIPLGAAKKIRFSICKSNKLSGDLFLMPSHRFDIALQVSKLGEAYANKEN